jgi:hypothetical protein
MKKKVASFKTIIFEIQVQDRRVPIKRIGKKEAIETARRTAKKHPDKAIRIIQIIKEYSEIDLSIWKAEIK